MNQRRLFLSWKQSPFNFFGKKAPPQYFMHFLTHITKLYNIFFLQSVLINPPTKKNNTKYEKTEYLKWVKTEYQVTPSAKIPNDNIALFFLDRAIRLCKDTKNICLILPSSLWLYSNSSHKFRKEFSELHDVQKVFDFTHLREVLFHGSGRVAVCAVLAELKYPSKKDIKHIIIQRIAIAEQRIIFEIDQYNKNSVPFELIENEQIWKANLLGGGGLFKVIQGLKNYPTFKKFIKNKVKTEKWVWGQMKIIMINFIWFLVVSETKKPASSWQLDTGYDSLFDYVKIENK